MELTITIFNCENDKYFITYMTNMGSKKLDPMRYDISTYVEITCPHIKQYDFFKNNKIISIKKIESIYIDIKSSEFRKSNGCAQDYINYTIDNIVFKYMNKYGIDNVRGGSYTDLELQLLTKQFIMDELKKLNNGKLIDNITGQPLNSQPLNSQPLNAQPLIDNITGQPLNSQPLNSQSLNSQPLNAQPLNAQPQISQAIQENYDLETILEDLNKMSYYKEKLNETKEIDQLNLNTIKLYSSSSNDSIKAQLKFKYPILDRMGIVYKNISTRSNFTKYLSNNLITKYLNLKAELFHMTLELAKLNSKYGSIENLQNIIDKEISNHDNIFSNEKLPLAIPVYNYDLSKNLYSKMLT